MATSDWKSGQAWAAPPITGHTRVVGVMAWPVTHTQSPPMHNAAYAAAGLELIYVAFPVAPERVGEAVRGARALGLLGINVTIPHKQAVIPFLDELSIEAGACGSVNTIQILDNGRLVGHSTDGFGFLKSLEMDAGYSPEDQKVVLVGTGGAGRAMAVSLALGGARSLVLLNRTESKRAELASVLEGLVSKSGRPGARPVQISHADPLSGAAREALDEADLIVNATSLGMKPSDPTPVDPQRLRPGQFVYDTIYTPAETRLLQEARRRGCRTLGGLGMLAYQGARAVEIWTGRWPDAELMKRVLARNLGVDPA